MIGVMIGMSSCPAMAASSLSDSVRIRSWLAELSEVRAKSPCAFLVLSRTYCIRSAVFCAWSIDWVEVSIPLAIA